MTENRHIIYGIAGGIIGIIALAAILTNISAVEAQKSMAMGEHTGEHTSMHKSSMRGESVLVHIASGDPADAHQVHRANMGVSHALAFYRSGFDVAIMLDVDGVRIATKNPSSQVKDINDQLKIFLEEGGRVIACNHCVKMAGLSPADLLDGVEIDGHPDMPRTQNLLRTASVVLDY